MPAQLSEKLVNVHMAIQNHLGQIEELFNKPVKITIIVRTSDDAEGNILLTNDTLRDVIGQLAIMDTWKPTLKPGDNV
jgi:arginine decarboxylase-like protein